MKILKSIAIALLLVFIVNTVFLPSYLVNDETVIEWILSGVVSGKPDAQVYLSSTLVNTPVAWLYTKYEGFNWHYIFLMSCYSVFIAAMLNYIVLDCNSKGQKLQMTVVIVSATFLLVLPQSTVIALLLVFVSFLYLRYHSLKGHWPALLTGLLLLCLGVIIRFEAVFVFISLCMPLLIWHYIKTGGIKYILIIVAPLLLLAANDRYEKHQINLKSGFDLERYIKATEVIIDNPRRITPEVLLESGFDSSSLLLLDHYFFIDPDFFNNNRVLDFADNIEVTVRSPLVFMKLWFHDLFMATPISLMLIYFLVYNRRMFGNMENTFFIISVLLLIAFLGFQIRLPSHIVLPLLYMKLYWVLLAFNGSVLGRTMKVILLSLLGLVIVFNVGYTSYHIKRNGILEEHLAYYKLHPNFIFQLSGDEFPIEQVAGFKNKFYQHPKNILVCGWAVGLPAYYEGLQRHGITNHMKAMLDRKDILIKLNFKNKSIEHAIIDFAEMQYDYKIEFLPADSCNLGIYYVKKLKFEMKHLIEKPYTQRSIK
jgi:hypothetical protein